MIKLGWNLVKKKEHFWVKVVRDKYKCGSDLLPRIEANKRGSNVWPGIKTAWGKVQDGIEITNRSEGWRGEKNGDFSVKTAYESMVETGSSVDPLWAKIWPVKVPERHRFFLWIVAHDRLLTNVARYKRGISQDPLCTLCGTEAESTLHVLRACAHSLPVWREVIPPSRWRRFSSLNYREWLYWNMNLNGSKDSRGRAATLWSYLLVAMAEKEPDCI